MVLPSFLLKHGVAARPGNPTSSYSLKKIENTGSHKNLRSNASFIIAASFIMVQKWEQPKSLPTDE